MLRLNRERITDDAENDNDKISLTKYAIQTVIDQTYYIVVILSVMSVDCWTVFATAANDTKFYYLW